MTSSNTPPMTTAIPSLEWAQMLAQQLVDACKKAGATSCDATVGMGSSLSASARDGSIEDVTRATSRTAGVRVIVDGKLGFATSADAPTDARGVEELAAMAVSLARVSTPSEHNVIPRVPALDPAELHKRAQAIATWDEHTAEASPSWAIEQALLMERIVRAQDGIAGVRDVSAGARRGLFALATSTGFSGAYRGTSASLSVSAVVDDAGGKKQIEGWHSSSRSLASLENAEAVAKEAARRALSRKGARKIETMKAPVIFDPQMARGFFSAILNALCGDMLARKQSFLAGKKAELVPVLVDGITLVDDPMLAAGFSSRPFDGEGVLTPKLEVIDAHGIIKTHFHDARSAARLGEAPTGHASRGASSLPSPSWTNATVEGGRGSFDDIVRDTRRGLVVTRLLGRGPDMVTGDYSRGASGFFVEDGAIAFPVEEVTIAGRMLEMMRGLDRVGADLDVRSSMRAPTIRFAELTISGK